MALQRHPIDSFDLKLNFWEEFPDMKIFKQLAEFYKANCKNKKSLKLSSDLMWALSLCYDRKSSFYAQPEFDKWEAVGDSVFGGDEGFLLRFSENDKQEFGGLSIPFGLSLRVVIDTFEEAIDTPSGLMLRVLEKKLLERTLFIKDAEYSWDRIETINNKKVLVKGTAAQIDTLFSNTEKIESLIENTKNRIKAQTGSGHSRGGGMDSLSDGDKSF